MRSLSRYRAGAGLSPAASGSGTAPSRSPRRSRGPTGRRPSRSPARAAASPPPGGRVLGRPIGWVFEAGGLDVQRRIAVGVLRKSWETPSDWPNTIMKQSQGRDRIRYLAAAACRRTVSRIRSSATSCRPCSISLRIGGAIGHAPTSRPDSSCRPVGYVPRASTSAPGPSPGKSKPLIMTPLTGSGGNVPGIEIETTSRPASSGHLSPTAIESGPTSGSTRASRNPASSSHDRQSAPV